MWPGREGGRGEAGRGEARRWTADAWRPAQLPAKPPPPDRQRGPGTRRRGSPRDPVPRGYAPVRHAYPHRPLEGTRAPDVPAPNSRLIPLVRLFGMAEPCAVPLVPRLALRALPPRAPREAAPLADALRSSGTATPDPPTPWPRIACMQAREPRSAAMGTTRASARRLHRGAGAALARPRRGAPGIGRRRRPRRRGRTSRRNSD